MAYYAGSLLEACTNLLAFNLGLDPVPFGTAMSKLSDLFFSNNYADAMSIAKAGFPVFATFCADIGVTGVAGAHSIIALLSIANGQTADGTVYPDRGRFIRDISTVLSLVIDQNNAGLMGQLGVHCDDIQTVPMIDRVSVLLSRLYQARKLSPGTFSSVVQSAVCLRFILDNFVLFEQTRIALNSVLPNNPAPSYQIAVTGSATCVLF